MLQLNQNVFDIVDYWVWGFGGWGLGEIGFVEGKKINRVDWSVIKHLNAQGRPDPKGGLHCFQCPNKT
jgi:hypothetical protein